jgi:hypothetical protein
MFVQPSDRHRNGRSGHYTGTAGGRLQGPWLGLFAAIPYGTSYTTLSMTGLLSIYINKLGNDGRPLTRRVGSVFVPIISFLTLGSDLRRPCSILMFVLLTVCSVSRRNSQRTQSASIIKVITHTHASPPFKKKCEFEVQILIKVPDIQNSTNSVQWEPKCLMRTYRQTGRYGQANSC